MLQTLPPVGFRASSGPWAVTGDALWRDGERAAVADAWELTCVLDRAGGQPPLVGAREAHLLTLDGDRLVPVQGFEHAEGRQKWYTPWGGPPDVRSLAADDEGRVYVNVHVGGVLRSLDGGSTWEPTPLDIDVDVHQVLCHDGPRPERPSERETLVLAVCGAGGLAVSRDHGETWSFRTEGLHATYCRAVAVAGDTVLVSASTGPHNPKAAVYRAPLDGDGPFERCSDFYDENVDTFDLAADGATVEMRTPSGEVLVSNDAGATWERAATAS